MSKSKFENVIAVAAFILVAWLLYENIKSKKKIKELQNDLDESQNLTKDIKERLLNIIENNTEIDPKVTAELTSLISLLEIKQDTTAVLKLAKIIENMLKELYSKDGDLKDLAKQNGRKTPSFADYIEYAKIKKVVSNEDYHLLSVLKIIRNEEAHELDIKKEKSRLFAAFLAGISLVLGLSNLISQKSLKETIILKN